MLLMSSLWVAYLDNVGKMRNQGFEMSLNYNDKFGEVTVGAGLNVAYNKNKIETCLVRDT